ncbi:RPA family protein [Haloarcula sp. H-GB5]
MSESGDSGPGRREVAHRLFAAEFDDADFSYSESDEERAPNYVVTPTGARVNRLFLVGVLTELEQVNDDVLRARVVDPTGPFVIYAGQYQPDELAFLEAADPPMFVAVTGKARTFQPDDSDRVFTSVRPESISEVDADTRDRWVVQAAEQTVSRAGQIASAKQTGLAGDDLRQALVDQGVDESAAAGITLALDHYGTTGDYLDALRTTALDAARVVAGDTDEAEGLSLSPDDGADDPIPLLASLDLDTDVSGPETTADKAGAGAVADEPEPVSDAGESETGTADDEPVAGTTESDTATEDAATDETADVTESSPSEAEPETVDSEPETSTTATSASEPEPSSETDGVAGGETTKVDADGIADEPEPATSTAPDSDAATADGDEDLGEFDPEFELDEDEREEIEQEYGTDFQTGTEVDEPGEAGIETPDPDEEMSTEADAGTSVDSEPETEPASATESIPEPEPEPEEEAETAPTSEPETIGSETETASEPTSESDQVDDGDTGPAEDEDLEDAAMEVMDELDDGNGADREELLAAVVDRYGADADAVDDAIQDALMGGRCYEPDDGKLKPI